MDAWRAGYPYPSRKGHFLLWCLLFAGCAAALVVSDDIWQWRDTLRRLARGEEAPAYRIADWQNPHALHLNLEKNLAMTTSRMAELGKKGRRDLALHALLTSAGEDIFTREGERLGALMEELGLDLVWLEELVYYCPLDHATTALPILTYIFHAERRGMEQPECRRLATAIAFEFGRAGKSKEEALGLYRFYVGGSRKSQLNSSFADLPLWRMRVLAERGTDARWGQ